MGFWGFGNVKWPDIVRQYFKSYGFQKCMSEIKNDYSLSDKDKDSLKKALKKLLEGINKAMESATFKEQNMKI